MIALLTLFACAPEHAAQNTPEDWEAASLTAPAPGDLILRVDGNIVGSLATFTVVDAYPYEDVEVLVNIGATAPGPCPASLGGVCLDLGPSTRRIGRVYTDVDGFGTLEIRLPVLADAIGEELCAQLASPRGPGGLDSAVSEVVCVTLDGDRDRDGLSDLEEAELGTDPRRPDTDGDEVRDGEDCAPLDPSLSVDCGGCGLLPSDCTLDRASYVSDFRLSPGTACTQMNVTFDGTHYWGYSGGTPSCRLNQWEADGTYLGDYGPGIDGRSVFTKVGCEGPTYLNGYASTEIREETSPGSYSGIHSLSGGSLSSQAVIAYDPVRELYVGGDAGSTTVDRWRGSDGAYVDRLILSGGSHEGYAHAVSNSGCYLTFSGSTLYSYDGDSGELIDSATLEGASSPNYTFSYANGYVFIESGDGWDGWFVGL